MTFEKCPECNKDEMEEFPLGASDMTEGQEQEHIAREINGERLFRCRNCLYSGYKYNKMWEERPDRE